MIPNITLEITSKSKTAKLDGTDQYTATARFTWEDSDSEPIAGSFIFPREAWNSIDVRDVLHFKYKETS